MVDFVSKGTEDECNMENQPIRSTWATRDLYGGVTIRGIVFACIALGLSKRMLQYTPFLTSSERPMSSNVCAAVYNSSRFPSILMPSAFESSRRLSPSTRFPRSLSGSSMPCSGATTVQLLSCMSESPGGTSGTVPQKLNMQYKPDNNLMQSHPTAAVVVATVC